MKNFLLMLGACFLLVSCSTGDALTAARIVGGSSQALTFLGCRAVSEDELEFDFSREVNVKHLSFEPEISIASIEEDGSTVRVMLAEIPQGGMLITADLLAEDEKRNTINVLVTLRTKNNRMPQLVINEICTEYSNPRTEFIEFKMKTAGNLGAMRVFIIGNSAASSRTIFEFSPVEVKKDEYVVLHLRSVEDSVKNEYGSNLDESGGRNASPTARDFWIPGNTKLIHKTSMIYVLDQDDNVLNAVMLCENPNLPWPKDYFTETANFLFEKSAWKSSDGITCRPADAIPSAATTNTRTINRDETTANTNSAANWYVTVTSGATPGRPNNQGRY
ncbi:MAG: hypothetical protein FWD40_11670 [Treponema sp.]|nr:hypothetical protein [Treponema sp.]